MTRLFSFILLLAAALSAVASDPRSENFNSGWRFCLGDPAEAQSRDFDDTGWRALTLPHDWAIEGKFSADNPSGTGGGALPGGIGWYRKTFRAEAPRPGQRTFLDFDGIYMNGSVYVNGTFAGTRPYGYASFSIDITDLLTDGDNTVAVRVDNSEQPNSRWYSGCGIYRNVWLRTVGDVSIPKDGTYITTCGDTITIRTAVENTSGKDRSLRLVTTVTGPDGTAVATATSEFMAPKNSCDTVCQKVTVPSPELWDVDSPNLYRVVSRIDDASTGSTLDTYATSTGFRSFRFDADKGFYLNGRPLKINGVCLHHDAGALGAVVNRAAIRRQLSIMKEMGCNAIRCSHNPPAPELLDLCDQMGFLVMDEAFDMWRKRKSAHDYARYFDQWHERDLDDMIIRDRNHPSIFVWSIGNEVLEQWTHADADTLSLAEANLILNFGHAEEQAIEANEELSVNSLLTIKLADRVRALDTTRPITSGCNEPAPYNHLFRSGALDIIGYNYHDTWFDTVPALYPGMPFNITESVSALATRGYYRMPSDSTFIWPARPEQPFFDPSLSCSSYDNCHVPWGSTHERSLRYVRDNDFISGQFVWTGFDYLGEPTPYGWPARSSFFGIVDLAGFPKDAYYLYQSEWRPDKTVLHILPHWNWTDGEEIDIWAYYNNADEVELYINGKSQGISAKTPERLHAVWRTRFEPGTVTAVSRKDGREVARREIRTAGAPHTIRLTPDRTAIAADGTALCYITAEIVDADGNLCPWADNEITFAVDGSAFNAGVDNGSPISHEPFKSATRRAFYGKALVIAQNNASAGPCTVTASAPGLLPCSISFESK